MDFEIIGRISNIETIASGRAFRDARRLHREYDRGYWRKLKRFALVRDKEPGKLIGRKSTGTKRPRSGERNSRSSVRSKDVSGYVVCVINRGYPVSLDVGKLYRRLKPLPADPRSRIRIIDESGEDYLYPRAFSAQATETRNGEQDSRPIGQ